MAKAGEVIVNTEPVAKVDDKVVQDLKKRAAAGPNGQARLCLHRDLGDPVQEMIIVHCKGAYVRPHKHECETESFHVIEGAMLVVLFGEGGAEVDRFRMGERPAGDCFVCRIEKGLWHTMVPLTDAVVFLETTQGPFRGEDHNTYASWAPQPDDKKGVAAFLERLGATG